MNTRAYYSVQAVLVYVALGVALGLIGWALLIHDGGADSAGAPVKSVPARGDPQR